MPKQVKIHYDTFHFWDYQEVTRVKSMMVGAIIMDITDNYNDNEIIGFVLSVNGGILSANGIIHPRDMYTIRENYSVQYHDLGRVKK